MSRGGSALGLPAMDVHISSTYAYYYEDGTVQSTEGDAPVITGAARIVKSNSTAHIYGKAGYDSFAAAGKSYQRLYFRAGEQSNQIHLTSSLTADYINVRNGVDLTIPQNVSLTVNEQLDIYGASLTVANGSFLTVGSLYVNDGGTLNNKGTVTCGRYFDIVDGSYWDEDAQRYVEGLPTGVTNEGRMTVGTSDTRYTTDLSGSSAYLTQKENAYLAFYGSLALHEGATLTVNSDVMTTTQSETGFHIVPGYGIYIYDYLYPGNVSLAATVSSTEGIAQQKSMYVMTYSEKMLREALKNDSYGAYDSVNIRYYADELTITEDLTIDRYVSFTYYDTELSILDGAILTVKAGTLTPASLSVAAGGKLILNDITLGNNRLNFKNAGTVVINEDGRLRCGSYKNTGTIENNGSIVVQPTLSVHDTYTTPAQGTMTGAGSFAVRPYCEAETEEEFWVAQGNEVPYEQISYSGDLTVNTDKTIRKNSYVSGDLEIKTGAVLSVNNNLTVNGDSICNGDIVITGDNVKSVWLELRGAVALNGSVTVNGGMLELWNNDSAALNGDITVNGGNLTLRGDKVMMNGSVLINGGELYLGSTDVYLNEGGSITLKKAEGESTSELYVESNASFHQLGSVSVEEGALIYISGLYEIHGTLTNLGEIKIAEVKYYTEGDQPNYHYGELQVMPEGLLTNSALISNYGIITVQGGMTPETGGTLVNELNATISNNNGAQFVINKGGIFTNNGTLSGTGTFEDKNSQV